MSGTITDVNAPSTIISTSAVLYSVSIQPANVSTLVTSGVNTQQITVEQEAPSPTIVSYILSYNITVE